LPAACGGGDSGEEPAAAPGAEAGDPATDELAQVIGRGTLTLSTDLRYPPQSFAVKGAKRAPASRCPANQLTAPQMAGYDADTRMLPRCPRRDGTRSTSLPLHKGDRASGIDYQMLARGDEQERPGRDRCCSTNATACGASLDPPLAVGLDDQQACGLGALLFDELSSGLAAFPHERECAQRWR
jgi:hypothetical protein